LSYRSFQKLSTHFPLYFTVFVRTFIFYTISTSKPINSYRGLKTFLKGKLFILIRVGSELLIDACTASITAYN